MLVEIPLRGYINEEVHMGLSERLWGKPENNNLHMEVFSGETGSWIDGALFDGERMYNETRQAQSTQSPKSNAMWRAITLYD